jgi:hypothetical protein
VSPDAILELGLKALNLALHLLPRDTVQTAISEWDVQENNRKAQLLLDERFGKKK